MTAPSQYLRDAREQRDKRRLEIARALREEPGLTNVQLAERFGVHRNTIQEDRDALIEQVRANSTTETELLRADMCARLESLNAELELHRRDGKLPVSAIHEMMLVHRSIIELLGVRKPVTEKIEWQQNRTIRFEAEIVPSPRPKVIDGEVVEPRLLKGDQDTASQEGRKA
jgi:DNA-binding XRE family transcriptional regulator